MTERWGYGFSSRDKERVHNRSNHCEFPDFCPKKPINKVNHLTGVFIARMEGLDKSAITDIDQNALLLCYSHEAELSEQEKYQQECIIYERGRPNQRRITRHNRSRFTRKRR